MPTNIPITKDFRESGHYRAFLDYNMNDTDGHAWLPLGMVEGPSFTTNRTSRKLYAKRGEQDTLLKQKVTFSGATVSFTALDSLDPRINDLLYQPTAQTITNTESVETITQAFPLYSDGFVPMHEYGKANATTLPTVTVMSASAVAATGISITPATYYVWAAPCWGTMPTAAAGLTGKDKTFIIGTPDQYSTTVVMAASKKFELDVRNPSTGPNPDFYLIFVNTTATLAHASTMLVTNGSNAGTLNAAALGATQTINGDDLSSTIAYSASNYVYVEEVTDPSATPWTVSARTLNTDYTYDANGLNIVSGGSLASGDLIRLYEWYIKPANVETPLGERTCPNQTFKLKFVRATEYDCSAADADERELCVEFTLEKCSLASDTSESASDDWDAGVQITMDVIYDGTVQGYGSKVIAMPSLATWKAHY